MRTILVVVVDELAEHRPQVLLVQNDEVVGGLVPQRANDASSDRVRTWRANGRRNGIDTDPSSSLPEVAAVNGVTIT
jgi:hypothetical protein